MARKAAAMPQLVCMNCRRLRPSPLLLTSASSRIRRSTRFCVLLCGGGRYSPFDTIWVGIGVAAEAASAPATRRCSRSLSQLLIVVLPGSVCDQRSLDLSIAPNPHSPDSVLNFWRGFRDSDIAISSLFWIKRGSDGEPDG